MNEGKDSWHPTWDAVAMKVSRTETKFATMPRSAVPLTVGTKRTRDVSVCIICLSVAAAVAPRSMVVLGQHACGLVQGDTGSYRLRVAGLFAILGGSAVMIMLPLVLKQRFQSLLHLGSAFACGIVLATAFVHILPDAGDPRVSRCPWVSGARTWHTPAPALTSIRLCTADAAMSSPCLGFSQTYPWASTFAGAAVLLMLTVENLTRPILFRSVLGSLHAACRKKSKHEL